MPRAFKVGEYVKCVGGCCEPGVIGRVAYFPKEGERYKGVIWVKFSKGLTKRHTLYSMEEIKHFENPVGVGCEKGRMYWSFDPEKLRHTKSRRLSP